MRESRRGRRGRKERNKWRVSGEFGNALDVRCLGVIEREKQDRKSVV